MGQNFSIERRPEIPMFARGLDVFLSADYVHVIWKIHHTPPN